MFRVLPNFHKRYHKLCKPGKIVTYFFVSEINPLKRERHRVMSVMVNGFQPISVCVISSLFYTMYSLFKGQSFRYKQPRTTPQTAGFLTFSQVSFWNINTRHD